jgi:RNA polymerase sigma factor for flagellar operon FliA
MISMQGVPSSLILRNQSWVRQQAQRLMRHLPSNVEKADLIQAGLIAVAQASLSFKWEGDTESEAARDAFVRYARLRVKGAMLDELRQRDHLGRSQRRKVKAMELAKERWRATHAREATTEELGQVCGMTADEIFELELAARSGHTVSLDDAGESGEMHAASEPATASDEVEARVDTGMLLRRLEKFFATLPQHERQVIDAYLGIGLTPVELARSMKVTPTRVSQLFKSICQRIGVHLGHTHQRSTDRVRAGATTDLDALITQREAQLAHSGSGRGWAEVVEEALGTRPEWMDDSSKPIIVDDNTRWG